MSSAKPLQTTPFRPPDSAKPSGQSVRGSSLAVSLASSPAASRAASSAATPRKLRLATVWLAGCSGCHMAFLDLDEWLFELAEVADIVYSPVASDVKTYPDNVDVCLVEGAVANADNLAMARTLRERTRVVVAFGDCAISAHVPGLRNPLAAATGGGAGAVLERAYRELATLQTQWPGFPGLVPELLERVLPLHEVIAVELWLPGCPPPVARIRAVLEALVRGELPRLEGPEGLRFG